jgi:3-hydroxymyristoyl/3-hydroxydecanoyl-(acyl carrier protein) dehydratase
MEAVIPGVRLIAGERRRIALSPVAAVSTKIELLHIQGGQASATVQTDPADPVFGGHYPGFPLFPGVYLVDIVYQTLLSAFDLPASLCLTEIVACRFRGPVFAGDRLSIELSMSSDNTGMVCQAQLATARGPVADLRLRCCPDTPARDAPAITEPSSLETPGRDAATSDPAPSPATRATIGVDQISAVIPHRPPFLLVDEVSELVEGRRITAHKAVSHTEPCFKGLTHQSCRYPAALLVESWAQAALVLALWRKPLPDVRAGSAPVAGLVEGIRFGAPVHPGDTIDHQVTLLRIMADTIFLTGQSRVGSSVVLTVTRLVAAVRDLDSLRPPSSSRRPLSSRSQHGRPH